MQSPKIIAGIDDATKCPCIGSIFLAGVVANTDIVAEWQRLGVKDSKLLTAKKREKLAKIIKETALSFSIDQLTPRMIDNKAFNLNEWEMLVVLCIIRNLQKNALFTDVYVDNWEVTTQLFHHRCKTLLSPELKEKLALHKIRFNNKRFEQLNLIAEHRADENHVIVGAASILAKTASDKQYAGYRRRYGNFGSGSPGDPQTRFFVWQHRHKPLPIIRTSWQTYKTLASLDDINLDPFYLAKLQRLKNKNK